MAMRVMVLAAARALCGISISPISVTELVVKKPSCYPIFAIGCWNSKIPVPLGVRIAALGDACYSFILRLL
jgi:hypothetical protein